MSGKRSGSTRAPRRLRTGGLGPCVICGEAAFRLVKEPIGTTELHGYVCERHWREYGSGPSMAAGGAMRTNLDAFAAQFFAEWRHVSSDDREERMKPQRANERLDRKLTSDPEAAWRLVVAIAERARNSDEVRQAVDFALVPYILADAADLGLVVAEAKRSPAFARSVSLLAVEYPDLAAKLPARDIQ